MELLQEFLEFLLKYYLLALLLIYLNTGGCLDYKLFLNVTRVTLS